MALHGSVIHEELVLAKKDIGRFLGRTGQERAFMIHEGSLQLYFPPADWFPGRLMCLTAPFLEMLGRKYSKTKIKIQNRSSSQNQKGLQTKTKKDKQEGKKGTD